MISKVDLYTTNAVDADSLSNFSAASKLHSTILMIALN